MRLRVYRRIHHGGDRREISPRAAAGPGRLESTSFLEKRFFRGTRHRRRIGGLYIPIPTAL